MLIYLIGFMGSGKTTIGKKLASQLGLKFHDLDRAIESSAGASIPEIFEKSGEEVFRKIEKEELHATFQLKDAVVSLGGGTPCFFDNMNEINKHGLSVYLKMHPNSLSMRLIDSTADRPLLKGKNEDELRAYVEETLLDREKYYLQSKIVFKGESVAISELVNKIESVM